MKQEKIKQIKEKHENFDKILSTYYDSFNKKYPGWKESLDSDYIKKRLNQAAQIAVKRRLKKKVRTLHKKDFADWPFKSDSVILVQTSKKWISVITDDMQEYALNGLASSGLHLKTISDAKKQIIGKSIMPFIQLGLEL